MTEVVTLRLDQNGQGSYTLRNARPEGSPAVDIYTQATFFVNNTGAPDGQLTAIGTSNPIRTTFINTGG